MCRLWAPGVVVGREKVTEPIPFDKPIIAIKSAPYTGCHCVRTVLDEQRRMIKCDDCGKWFEPYDWVKGLAYKERALISTRGRLKADIKRHGEMLREVRRQLRNARARLRNAPKG